MITSKEAEYTFKKSKMAERESFLGVDFDEYYDHINRLFVSNYPQWSLSDFIDELVDFNQKYDKNKKGRN